MSEPTKTNFPTNDAYNPAAFDATVRSAVESLTKVPIADADKPGIAEVFGAAWRTSNTIGSLMSSNSIAAGPDTADDEISGSQIIEAAKRDGVYQYLDRFESVQSRKKYEAVVADIKREEADRRTLHDAGGLMSFAAEMTTGLVDPVNFIPVGGAAARFGKLGKNVSQRVMLEQAMMGGVSAVASEAVLQATQQTRTKTEAFANVSAGMLLGGLLGVGAHKVLGNKALIKVEDRLNADMQDAVNGFAKAEERVAATVKALDEAINGTADVTAGAASKNFAALSAEAKRVKPASEAVANFRKLMDEASAADNAVAREAVDAAEDGAATANSFEALEKEFSASPLDSDVRRALTAVISPAFNEDTTREAVLWAVKNGRRDIAEAILNRADEAASRSKAAKPGVDETSPKYEQARARLTTISEQNAKFANEIRELVNPEPPSLFTREPLPTSAGAAANTEGRRTLAEARATTTGDYVDAKLIGINVKSLVEKAPDLLKKIPVVGQIIGEAITVPRMNIQRAQSNAAREALRLIDDGTWISRQDMVGEAVPTTNIVTTMKALDGQYAIAMNDLKKVWKDAAKEFNGDLDEFSKAVARAMVNGDKDVANRAAVNEAARLLRTGVYKPILDIFHETGILNPEVHAPRNAQSYLPIRYHTDIVRARADEFKQMHADAFYRQARADRQEALDLKRAGEAKVKAAVEEARVKADEEIKKIAEEYGNRTTKPGKIRDAISDYQARQQDIRDFYKEKRSQRAGDKFAEGSFVEQQKRDLEKLKADHDKRLAELEAERAAKIEAAEAKVREVKDKALAEIPEYQKKWLSGEFGVKRSPDEIEDALRNYASTLAKKHYDAIVDNHLSLALDHDINAIAPGLRNMLKSREGNVTHLELIDKGFVDGNVFRLAADYHRKAGADAALARAFKKEIEVKGKDGKKEYKLVGDIHMTDTLRRVEADYKIIIDSLSYKPLSPKAEATFVAKNGKSSRELLAEAEAATVDEMNRTIASLKTAHQFIRGSVTIGEGGTAQAIAAWTPRIMSYNALRLMGGTVASSLGDPINIIVAHGWGNAFKFGFLPAIRNYGEAISKDGQLAKLNRFLGAAIEHEHNSMLAAMTDAGSPIAAQTGRGSAMVEQISHAFWDYTGLTYWTNWQKNIAANVTHGRIITAAVEGWEKQSKRNQVWLTNLGIDKEMLGRIAKEYDTQPQKTFGARGEMLIGDPRVWKDADAINVYRGAIAREASFNIVTPGALDRFALQATPQGQLIMQFRNFGVAAQGKMLGRNAALNAMDGDSQLGFYTGLMALVAGGVLVESVKATMGDTTLLGQSKSDDARGIFHRFTDKWEKTPGEFLYNVIDRSVPLFHIMEVNNIANKLNMPNLQDGMAKLFGDDEGKRVGSSKMRNRGVFEAAFGPTAGLIENTAKVVGQASGAAAYGIGISQNEPNPARSDFARFRSLVPFQNAPVIQQIFNHGERELGHVYGWPAR